jgi:hypothetical protein
MPGTYGSAYSSTDDLYKAPGATVDAGLRRIRNVFDLANAAITAQTVALLVARLREGMAVQSIEAHTDANISAINLSFGPASSNAKYVAATAGPNATTKRFVVKFSALDDDPLTAPEDVLVTPSGNWPAAGTLIVDTFVSKR